MNTKQFIFAGNAIWTIDNGKGEHFTFKVIKPDEGTPFERLGIYFVYVLNGPDNTKNYAYMGVFDTVNMSLSTTKGSKVFESAKSWKVAYWALNMVSREMPFPPGYRIHHEGKCGRCGRKLTVPSSVISGIGPECASIMGIA